MKKLLAIIVLGLLFSGNAFAETKKKDKDSVYLECKTPGGPFNGYGIYRNLKLVMVSQPDRLGGMKMVSLKISAGRYDFEYYPLGKDMPMKRIISINRFTGDMTLTLEAKLKGKNKINVFQGKCFERDLDKPKL